MKIPNCDLSRSEGTVRTRNAKGHRGDDHEKVCLALQACISDCIFSLSAITRSARANFNMRMPRTIVITAAEDKPGGIAATNSGNVCGAGGGGVYSCAMWARDRRSSPPGPLAEKTYVCRPVTLLVQR